MGYSGNTDVPVPVLWEAHLLALPLLHNSEVVYHPDRQDLKFRLC
jgi:hypothetical protein